MPWLTLACVGLALAALVWPALGEALQFDRQAVAHGQWWRWLTAHLAHWNFEHFGWDATVFLLLGALCEQRSRTRWMCCLLGAATGITAVMWLTPSVTLYRGLSGLGSAAFALLAVTMARQCASQREWGTLTLIVLGLGAFVAKSVYECVTGGSLFVSFDQGGVSPMPSSHIVGAAVGILSAVARWPALHGKRTGTSAPCIRRGAGRSALAPCLFGLILAIPEMSFAADDAPSLAGEVKSIFAVKCSGCHAPDAVGASAARARRRLSDVRDLQAVVQRFVQPGDLDASTLWQEISDQSMPPVGAPAGALSEEQIDTVRRWIVAGAPLRNSVEVRGAMAAIAPAFITDDDVLAAVLADLARLEPSRRRTARYFTLANLRNAGGDDATLDVYRVGLAKLIDSLSWSPTITAMQPVDAAATVYRVDLAALGWGASDWERIAADDPFAQASVVRVDPALMQALRAMTGTREPIVRGDHFAFVASRPPLYHDLLRLPETDRELESLLAVNAARDIERGDAKRAGVVRSGVSQHNRVVERHATRYGAYWKSYDFNSSVDRQDIRSNPLGPGGGPRSFRHAGGEIIFNLPNGMQAYLLTSGGGEDKPGKRIDTAPIQIVQDQTRDDRVVVNGISCMSCHDRGMKPAADVVRPHALANAQRFGADELQQISRLYVERDAFALLIDRDAQCFAAAVAASQRATLRNSSADALPAVEPISALVERFEQPVTSVGQLASELGVAPATFAKLASRRADLRDLRSRVEQPGGVPREQLSALIGRVNRSRFASELDKVSPGHTSTDARRDGDAVIDFWLGDNRRSP